MMAEASGRLAEHRRSGGGLDRLVGIIVATGTFKGIATTDQLAAEISGLSRYPAELVEAIIAGLELVVAQRPVLDGHGVRNGLGAVLVRERTSDAEVGGQEAPMQRAPVHAGAADALAGQEGAEASDRQRALVGRVAEGDGVDRIVLH